LSGLQGEFYRQFALTIAIATILSAVNSLTLSPALAGMLLRARANDGEAHKSDGWIGRALQIVGRGSGHVAEGYAGLLGRLMRTSFTVLFVYTGLLAITGLGLWHTPQGFVPAQDKYYLVGIIQLPNAASLDRTEDVTRRVSEIALAEHGVETVVAFPGLSINGFVNIPNAAVLFVMLDPFEKRRAEHLTANAIAGRLQEKLRGLPDGFIGVFPPPPVAGLGAMGGFRMQIEDRGGAGLQALAHATGEVMQRASRDPALAGMMSTFDISSPQIGLDIDREKAKTLGVPLAAVFETLQVHLGSMYVNDFNRFGRTYRVVVQADAPHRTDPSDIGKLQVRNGYGTMVPLATLVKIKPTAGPDRVMHYNGYVTADISGGPAPGTSSAAAVAAMERIAKDVLPAGMAFEWTDLTYQEKAAGDTSTYVFSLSVLLAFLILAALYNSWTIPFAVLLIVPMALLSALAGVWMTNGDNNIFTQIGFIVLVGLAAKNAILIVEFARKRQLEGLSDTTAAIEAAGLRLRPIVMTSLAFVAGVVPLAVAYGAGSEMRQAMGVAVLFGMLGVTAFGLFLTPVFYVLTRRLGALLEGRTAEASPNGGAPLHREAASSSTWRSGDGTASRS
jgi:gold/copper resistance efflux pump